MRNETRKLYTAMAAHIAQLNDVQSSAEKFTINPSVQQTLETKIQDTSDFLKKINVIGVTEGIYNDTVAVTKARPEIYNPEFIKALQDALINIIGTEEGKAIFDVYSHTGYAVAQDSDYDGARKALEAVK